MENHQLQDRIRKALKNRGIRKGALQEELIDHYLTQLERELDQGKSEQAAWTQIETHLNEINFKQMNRQVFFIHHKKRFIMNASLLLMFTLTALLQLNPAKNIYDSEVITVAEVCFEEQPYLWPLKVGLNAISSGFGYRIHPIFKKRHLHRGVDFRAKNGDPVLAPANAIVKKAEYKDGYGNHIVLQHDEIYETTFSHLSEILVQKGDSVLAGFQIGKVGNTGKSTAPHLHYEVLKNGKPVDPMDYLVQK